MPIPVVKQGTNLIVSLNTTLSDEEWVQAQAQLANQVAELGVRSVVVDLTSVEVLDSFATRMLRSLAETIRLRGVTPVIVGIGPDVAYAMVQLGLRLEGIDAALDLDDGLELIRRRERAGGGVG